MTYVEFPVDNIVGVHWFDPDDPPPIDPDNPPSHLCGEYIRDESYLPAGVIGNVPLGPPDYSAGFGVWLTSAGLFFNPRYGQPVPPGTTPYPYTDPRDVPMSAVLRYEIEYTITSGCNISANSLQYPNGTPLQMVAGSGIGLGYTNHWTDPHFRIGVYPTSPHPPNIDTGSTGNLTNPGDALVSTASGEYDMKQGDACLWMQATGELLDLHNIHTEPAPPHGWMQLDFVMNHYYLRIKGFCLGAGPP